MTKFGLFKLGAIALALAVGLSVCTNEIPGSHPNTEALLKTITIAGTEVEKLPEPITSAVWDEPDEYLTNLRDDQIVKVILSSSAEIKPALIEFTASKNAEVMLANNTNWIKPKVFYNPPTIFLNVSPILYVRITSQDKSQNRKTINYYRFETEKPDPVTTISSLTIGIETFTDFNDSNSSTVDNGWNYITSPATVKLSSDNRTGVQVAADSKNTAAKIQYAKVEKGSVSNPVFESIDEDKTFDFADGDALYIKVTTEDGKDSRWYKFLIKINWD